MPVINGHAKALDDSHSVDILYLDFVKAFLYLDFVKAFDSALHNCLDSIMQGCGISGKLLAWVNFVGRKQTKVNCG